MRSYNVQGVMARSGFSGIRFTSGGKVYEIPASGITKRGVVRKSLQRRIDDDTVEAAMWLNNRGVCIYAA